MFNILKMVVSSIIVLLTAYVIITGIYEVPSERALFTLIGMGVVLMIIGIVSNIRTNSPIRVGTINRAEFYGVVVAMVSYMIYMNTRIDQIMFKLME